MEAAAAASPSPSASADGGAFLEFVDYAISLLTSSPRGDGDESAGAGPAPTQPPWGWTVALVLKSCRTRYSSDVTAAILLSDLIQEIPESGLDVCVAAAIIAYAVPMKVLVGLWGMYAMRPPRFRRRMLSPLMNFFRLFPSKADILL